MGEEAGIESLERPRSWAAELAACAIVGAVLGVFGPFGSFFNDAMPVRIAYWAAVLLVMGALFGAVVRWIWPKARRRGIPVGAWGLPVALAVAAPVALVSRLLAIGLWPGIRHTVGMAEWYGQAAVISLAYLSLYLVLRSRAMRAASPPASDDPSSILDRLPPRLGRDLICLQMEDHYVRVHTTHGSSLLLMPMARAIAAAGAVEGMRIHRSWWVARHAVQEVVRDGRNLRLRLISGQEAPIARAKIAILKTAGWLPPNV